MKIPQKVIRFLSQNKVNYEIINHRTVYTAYDKAATLKVRLNMIGKTLIVKTDGDLTIILIPGNKNLDKNKFKKLAKIKKLDFISEKLMKNKFKGVKIGAIPPFGSLWRLPTFIDKSLINSPKIIINSGDYNFSIKLKGAALKKLIPSLVIGNFTKVRK